MDKRFRFCCVLLFTLLTTAHSAWSKPHRLNKNSQALFLTAMRWADNSWDPQTKFLHSPQPYSVASSDAPHATTQFLVRESSWYALGLLLRDQPGDRDKAANVLRAVLKQQYDDLEKPWYGTFRRSPEEPEPDAQSAMWRAYDPNWREFIGTTFAIILNEYADRIPADLDKELLLSIDHAVAGEKKQGRLKPNYTNIALMYGYLLAFDAGKSHPEWAKDAANWREDVYKLYRPYNAFEEYNSPTYAGTDFYGLALWRIYGDTRMRALGSEMEAGLWTATADFYNADMRNVSGPYDRSYGMDMQSYVSVVGLWLGTVLNAKQSPLPDLAQPPVDHVADLFFVPNLVVLGTKIPFDALESFRSFSGEHAVHRQITEDRIATAWIGQTAIYGGEITGHTRGVDGESQFHPVTVQWQMPNGKIGWIQLTRTPPIDASARQGEIVISATGDVRFRIYAPGRTGDTLHPNLWSLPGLTVRVTTDAKSFNVLGGDVVSDLSYGNITHMILAIDTTTPPRPRKK
jgi:hypothetical protein